MDQHAEVAELLRNLVRGGREPGRDSESDIDQEDAGDSETSEEVVQAVSEQDEIGERLLAVGGGPVAVVPVEELLEREEEREAGQGPQEDGRVGGRLLHRCREHVEEGPTEE